LTKLHNNGWREKLAQWADKVDEWVAEIFPIAPVPVPVRVRPKPRPPRR